MALVVRYVYSDEFGNEVDCGFYAVGEIYDNTYSLSKICLKNKVKGIELHAGTKARAKRDGFNIGITCTETIYEIDGYGDNAEVEEKLNSGNLVVDKLKLMREYTIYKRRRYYPFANKRLIAEEDE